VQVEPQRIPWPSAGALLGSKQRGSRLPRSAYPVLEVLVAAALLGCGPVPGEGKAAPTSNTHLPPAMRASDPPTTEHRVYLTLYRPSGDQTRHAVEDVEPAVSALEPLWEEWPTPIWDRGLCIDVSVTYDEGSEQLILQGFELAYLAQEGVKLLEASAASGRGSIDPVAIRDRDIRTEQSGSGQTPCGRFARALERQVELRDVVLEHTAQAIVFGAMSGAGLPKWAQDALRLLLSLAESLPRDGQPEERDSFGY
jgi:hypothetical protein